MIKSNNPHLAGGKKRRKRQRWNAKQSQRQLRPYKKENHKKTK